MEEKKATNIYSRVVTLLYVLFLIGLVSYALKGSNPPSISTGIITILLIVTVLILSESFDNLSIGKILSLSKEVKKKEQEIQLTKHENSQLRSSLLQLTTTVCQHQAQSNTTINGVTPEFLQMLGVVKAKGPRDEVEIEEEILKKKAKSEDISTPNGKTETDSNQKEVSISPYVIREFAEKKAFDKYLSEKQIPELEVLREVEIASALQGIDPIGERKVIFDGYLKTPNKEIFFDVRSDTANMMLIDRIYVQLAKVFFYRQAKKVQAELVLIFVRLPEDESGRLNRPNNINRFMEIFQPAIANDLLRVETIEFDKNEFESLKMECPKSVNLQNSPFARIQV